MQKPGFSFREDIMNDCSDDRQRKRGRDECSADPYVGSPELKIIRVESASGISCLPETELNRVDLDDDANSFGCQLTRPEWFGLSVNSNDSEPWRADPLNSPEAKRIQDDLLNILEESDVVSDRDLDSVMRSYEEEILLPVSGPIGAEAMTSFEEIQPHLGYLQEASDNELGIPPKVTSGKEKNLEEDIDSVKEVPEAKICNGFIQPITESETAMSLPSW